MAEREVLLKLNARADTSAATGALRDLGQAAGKAGEQQRQLQATFDKAIQGGQQRQAAMQLAGKPDNLRQQVELTLQLEEAQRGLNLAVEAERERQTGKSAMQERVEQTLQAEEAQKRYNEALDAERERRGGEKKGGGDEGRSGVLGAVGGAIGGRFGGILQSIEGLVSTYDRVKKSFEKIGKAKGGGGSGGGGEGAGPAATVPKMPKPPSFGGLDKKAGPEGGGRRGGLEAPGGKGGGEDFGFHGAKGGDGADLFGKIGKGEGKAGGGDLFGKLTGGKGGGGIGDIVGGGEAAGGEAAGGAGGGMAAMAGPAAIAVVAIGVLAGAAKKAAEVIWQGVQLASPATVDRFNVAMEDTIATIGGRFAPVVDFLTGIVQDAGDAFATILPSTEEIKDLMDQAKTALAPLKDAFYEIAPLLKETFVLALRGTGIVVKWFGDNVIKPAGQAVKNFANWLGIRPAEKKSSAGAAVRDVKEVNNLEDVFRDAAKAGLMSGGSRDELTISNMETMLDRVVEKLSEKLKSGLGERMDRVTANLRDKMEELSRAFRLNL